MLFIWSDSALTLRLHQCWSKLISFSQFSNRYFIASSGSWFAFFLSFIFYALCRDLMMPWIVHTHFSIRSIFQHFEFGTFRIDSIEKIQKNIRISVNWMNSPWHILNYCVWRIANDIKFNSEEYIKWICRRNKFHGIVVVVVLVAVDTHQIGLRPRIFLCIFYWGFSGFLFQLNVKKKKMLQHETGRFVWFQFSQIIQANRVDFRVQNNWNYDKFPASAVNAESIPKNNKNKLTKNVVNIMRSRCLD